MTVRHRAAALVAWLGAVVVLTATAVGAAPDPTPAPDGTVTQSASGAASAPLVILFDVSDSMNEEDGTGTVKLEGAKAALIDVVRRQPAGSTVGLWPYPGSGNDCAPGGYISTQGLERLADPSVLGARIRTLTASGNTPTGQALEAVANDLAARNRDSATLLLVSDGESNCGVNPCEVAKEVVARGFDITVQAMGFQISDEGRAELECIANATNGEYFDVADTAALAERLDELAVPGLSLDVTHPTTVPAGSGATVTAVVSNPSAREATNVTVSLTFTNSGSQALFPAVIPPRYRLGNIPPGESVTRTWTLSTSGGRTGTANLRAAAWSSQSVTSVDGVIEVTDRDIALSEAGDILTDAVARGPVVIAGDSYSAGEGSRDYIEYSTREETRCHRSWKTYGVSLFGQSNVEIIACSGAVAGDLLSYNHEKKVQAQVREITALDRAPGLVLMTMGGNDIDFGGIVKKCALPGDNCAEDAGYASWVSWNVAELQSSLEGAYRTVYAAANSPRFLRARDGAIAPVVVLTYPQVTPDPNREACSLFDKNEVAFANKVIDRLDGVSAAAVRAVAESGLAVYSVPTVQQAVLPNHTMCDEDAYINPLGVGSFLNTALPDRDQVELVHPNPDGYRAMTNALVAWSQTATAIRPTGPTPTIPTTVGASTPVASVQLSGASTTTLQLTAGQAVQVTVTDLAPGSTVTITVRSSPRAVASWVADDDGVASGVVVIPPDLPAGLHTLTSHGYDADYRVVEHTQPVMVHIPRPWWFWPAVGGAGLALVGAAVLLVLAARERRAARSSTLES